MNYDLKIIKKKYGENMMRLLRTLFPTLLEEKGLLSELLLKNFNPSKELYDDIKNNNKENEFKMFIYGFLNKDEVTINSKKTPMELFDELNYDFYECKTEDDIKKFRKYYARGEELCTFKDKRLNKCYVFFVVKRNIDEIKRENFKNPIREDEYGTSIMSIQFTKDDAHTLSIKNRYNHALLKSNPDATYKNNLENIVPGLTKSFENTYGLVQKNPVINFEMKDYIRGDDGKFYKYNYEINNIYYCTDNVIIDNFEVKKLPRERYIVMDYFVLDMKDKKIMLYDSKIDDSFISSIKEIKKIDVLNEGKKKTIVIICDHGNVIIKLDENDRIIELEDNTIKKVSDNFLKNSKYLESILLNEAIEIGDNFLNKNEILSKISMDNVISIGNDFLAYNNSISEVSFPKLEKIGNAFLFKINNPKIKKLYLPNVKIIGDKFMFYNNSIMEVDMPNVIFIGNNFFMNNKIMSSFNAPSLREIKDACLENNLLISEINLQNVSYIGKDFLKQNQSLIKFIIPNITELKAGTLKYNYYLKELYAPYLKKISENVLVFNSSLSEFESLYLEEIGNNFLEYNRKIKKFILPSLRKIGTNVLKDNDCLEEFNAYNLDDEYKNNLSKYMKEMLKQGNSYVLKPNC